MEYETIEFKVEDRVATILLNRPEVKNAINGPMHAELADAVARLRKGEYQKELDVRALIIRGTGGAFCTGGDLRGMDLPRTTAQVRNKLIDAQRWYANLLNLEMPVISAVDGPAFGAGFSLCLVADFILATPRAAFCSAFARMGLVPDLGTLHVLPRMIGMQRAKEIVFSTRVVRAEEAKAIGLVYDIVESDRLEASAMALARRFHGASMTSIGLSKVLLNKSFEIDQRAMAELESMAQGTAATSPEHKEALQRFLNKQPLDFTGFTADDWKADADE